MRTAKQEALKKAKEAAGLSAAAVAALEAAGGGISVEALLTASEQVWSVCSEIQQYLQHVLAFTNR